MEQDVSIAFKTHFGNLTDPRVRRRQLHPLVEILFLVLCASICGAESWRDFVLFGNEKIDFLKKYFPFSNGVPSKNTFARLFSALNPEIFRSCFIEWVKSFQAVLNDVIVIDGKTLCNSYNTTENTSAIHVVFFER